jgi:acyl carrier protein
VVRIESSKPFGDAPCPHCGSLLWFLATPAALRFAPPDRVEDIQELVLGRLAGRLAVSKEALRANPSLPRERGIDSLELVELIVELEEEIDLDLFAG